MSLFGLQSSSQHLARQLQQAALAKSKAHPFFRSGIFNAGKWLNTWEKMQRKKVSTGDAALMASFLPYVFPNTGEQVESSIWPWQQRRVILSQKHTKRWLSALYALDEYASVYVDLIPHLGEWLGDVFNYIPRDVWSMLARLLGRLYYNSKQLFQHLQSRDESLSPDDFFFHRLDAKLKRVFDFSKPPK